MPGARVASGECVTLRTIERGDVPFLSRQTANPGLRIPSGNPVKNQASIEDAIEEDFGDNTRLMVCLDGGDAGSGPPDEADVRRIGVVTVKDRGRSRPELGFHVVPEHHGEGYGSEAVSLVVDHVFRMYHHPAVGAKTFPHNEPSRGLLESLGFTQEGRIRDDWFWDGQYRDYIQYGLLRENWHDQD